MTALTRSTARILQFAQLLGPGLLYAGAAVGVSHLVQSTRAGALYGWLPVIAIVFSHAAKYPFFKIGPRFALATGRSLVQGYRDIGRSALLVFVVFTFGTMFAVIAAITSVTAGIAMYVFDLGSDPAYTAGAVLAISVVILLSGKYHRLESIMRLMILLLTISTVVAFVLALSSGRAPRPETVSAMIDGAFLAMLVKLMGWMPAPLDLSVWHSLWAVQKKENEGENFSARGGMLDFEVGYWGTMVLGVLFLGLGALYFFGSAASLPESGVGFSQALLQMYTAELGPWAFAVIAVAALATMFSTTLTVLDAIPRSLAEALKVSGFKGGKVSYSTALIILAAGAFALLTFWAPSMTDMVDVATVLSFGATPVLAWLNLRAMRLPYVKSAALSRGEERYAYICLAALTALAVLFFALF
ncbi:MAG: divalent metal cation transporter [Flavobacteriales bacterium]|nr:divalent metal cation transporter [Flavobacteriales bacterium]